MLKSSWIDPKGLVRAVVDVSPSCVSGEVPPPPPLFPRKQQEPLWSVASASLGKPILHASNSTSCASGRSLWVCVMLLDSLFLPAQRLRLKGALPTWIGSSEAASWRNTLSLCTCVPCGNSSPEVAGRDFLLAPDFPLSSELEQRGLGLAGPGGRASSIPGACCPSALEWPSGHIPPVMTVQLRGPEEGAACLGGCT